MVNSILYIIIIGFFGLCLLAGIINMILDHRVIPNYSYERALRSYRKLQQKGGVQWRTTLLALIGANIISWVTLYRSEPISAFIIALIFVNLLFVIRAANEFETLRLTTKRLKELETVEYTNVVVNESPVQPDQATREE